MFCVCSLFIFVWVCRGQVVFCVWKMKVLLLVTLRILFIYSYLSPAQAECWGVDSEILWGPSCFPPRMRLRRICDSPGRSVINPSLRTGSHQVGPGCDEKPGKVVYAWPKSIAMIGLRHRRPKDELLCCFSVGISSSSPLQCFLHALILRLAVMHSLIWVFPLRTLTFSIDSSWQSH